MQELFRRLAIGDDAALAAIIEASQTSDDPTLLVASDQAIDRVLAAPELDSKNRVEALTLKGRNQKTRWRLKFEHLDTTAKRRAAEIRRIVEEAHQTAKEVLSTRREYLDVLSKILL